MSKAQIDQAQLSIAKNLTNLFNKWLSEKQIPKLHTTNKMFFIYKNISAIQGGTKIEDLRPISVTSILYKILELSIKQHITLGIENGLIQELNHTQHGFRAHLGTEPNILKLAIQA